MKIRIIETNEFIVEIDETKLDEEYSLSGLDRDEIGERAQAYLDDWYGGQTEHPHLRPLPDRRAPAIISAELAEGGGVEYEIED